MAKKLERELGLPSVISIACGAMISGLLVLPGYAAKMTGASAYLAFLLAGILFIPATLSKSEMTTAIPESGGDYLFIDRALGPLFSTISGIGMFLTFILKAAFALAGMAAYLFLMIPVSSYYATYFAAGIAIILTTLNYLGAKKAGQVQTILVVITAFVLSAFLLKGTTQVHIEYFEPFFLKGWKGFFTATAFVFVSYAGVTKVASVAEEVKNPGTNIPVGMLISLIIMIMFYTAVVYVTVGTVTVSDLTAPAFKNAPLARVGLVIFGWAGEYLMAGMSVLALMAMANAGIMASSRYPLALSRQNQLPEIFERIHHRFSTPSVAVLSTGALLLASILFLPVIDLAKLASTFKLLVLAFFNMALIILRESDIEWYKPEFRSPLYPYVQIFGAFASLSLIVFLGWLPLLTAMGLIIGGFIWYYAYVRERVDRKGALFREPLDDSGTEVFQKARSRRYSGKESVIVPFFGLDDVDMLHVERQIRLAAALCDYDERLDIVNFVEVPEQSFLSDYEALSDDFAVLKERVNLLKTEIESEIHLDEVVTHSSRGAIRNYAEEEKPHWIVFDWKEPSPWQSLLGRDQEKWLQNFPTDMLFFDDRERMEFPDVLAITDPGPFDGEIVYAADHIAGHYGGTVTFLNPAPEGDREKQFLEEYQQELRNMCDTPSHSETIPASSWTDRVIEKTEEADLLVIGGLTEERYPDFRSKELGQEIMDRADCSVAKIQSTLRRPRTVFSRKDRDEDSNIHIEFLEDLQETHVTNHLIVENKEKLFRDISKKMTVDQISEDTALKELWKREEVQNTYAGNGLAMPNAIVEGYPETRLFIFGLSEPIPYNDEEDEVEICIATFAPPSERGKQLELIGNLSMLFLKNDLKKLMRASDTSWEIIEELQKLLVNESRGENSTS